MDPADSTDAAFGFYRRLFALAMVALLGLLLYRVITPFLAPLAWATVVGYLMDPLQARLTRLLRGRAGIAAGILTLVCFVMLVGPLTLLAGAFATQVGVLVGNLQRLVTELRIGSVADLADLAAVRTISLWLERHLAISAEQLQAWLVTGGEQLLIFYRIEIDQVEIVRVVDGRRDVDSIFGEDEKEKKDLLEEK